MPYVVCQSQIEDLNALHRLANELKVSQWAYIGEDSAWRIRAEQAIGPQIPRISIAERLDKIAWKLRQPYIDWIGQLSQVNNSLEWWASGLAGKNPLALLYVRICLLASAIELIRSGLDSSTLIICSSRALLIQVLRCASISDTSMHQLAVPKRRPGLLTLGHWRRRYLRVTSGGVRRVTSRLRGRMPAAQEGDPAFRRRVLASRGVSRGSDFSGDGAILVFTWVDQRNFMPDGTYHDPYFNGLPEMLRQRGYSIAYVPRVHPSMRFEEAVDRLLNSGEHLFFPDLFISLEDISASEERGERYQPTIAPDSKVNHVPVHDLVQEQVEYDRRWIADSLVYERLAANLSDAGIRPKWIIHPWEGQSWEQVLAWSVRRHMPGTSVVGYDMGIFSRMFLSAYPARNEFGLRPLPDRVITNGPMGREALTDEGLPREIVKSGCAMRFPGLASQLADRGNIRIRAENSAVRILVAPSIGFGDSVDLVAKAIDAFGGSRNIELVVKCHPFVSVKEVVNNLGHLARHNNVSFSDMPAGELLSSAYILLYTLTTVCFDALRQGVTPVFVMSENGLNVDKLEAAPEVRWVATSPEDLRLVVAEIVALSEEERAAWQERANEVLRRAFAPVTPECVDAFVI